jgi:hypothetical protein
MYLDKLREAALNLRKSQKGLLLTKAHYFMGKNGAIKKIIKRRQ